MTRHFGTTPLYKQARDAIADRIAAGEWPPGQPVPNELNLALELGVSPGTMRKALDLLEAEGLVTRRQGRGTFVNELQSPERASRYSKFCSPHGDKLVGNIEAYEVYDGVGDAIERKRLLLGADDHVYRVRRGRTHDGSPYLYETVSFPRVLFPDLPAKGLTSSGLTTIAHAYGLLLGSSVETVSPGGASDAAAILFAIPRGSPVLVLRRVINLRDGRPAQWRFAECCMPEGMQYKVEA